MLTGILVPIAIAVAFVAGSVVGAIFHKWFEKQASDAKIRAAQDLQKAVAAVMSNQPPKV